VCVKVGKEGNCKTKPWISIRCMASHWHLDLILLVLFHCTVSVVCSVDHSTGPQPCQLSPAANKEMPCHTIPADIIDIFEDEQ
jgi:hypothetical protein